MRVIFTINQPGGLIQSWAYENSGSTIQAGTIPETSVACLAGLASLALLRRKHPC